jgi:hypothetical protein
VAAALLAVPGGAGAAEIGYRNAVLGDGATAYYQFDENVLDLTAADVAGGDNNGTYAGGVGKANSAYPNLRLASTFDGTDDRVRIPDSTTFDLGTGPVTVELWYNSNVDARGDLFTYKGAGGDFGLHANSEADPAGFTGSVSLFFNGFTASPAGSSNMAWHHVALTRDAAGTVNLYVDGVVRGTGTDADTLNITNDLLIGSNHGGDPANPAIPFNGSIDEVAWYPVALTQAQIQNHIDLAVPEPASAGLFAAGGLLLLGRRRRR